MNITNTILTSILWSQLHLPRVRFKENLSLSSDSQETLSPLPVRLNVDVLEADRHGICSANFLFLLGMYRISGLFWNPVSGRISNKASRISGIRPDFRISSIRPDIRPKFFIIFWSVLGGRIIKPFAWATLVNLNNRGWTNLNNFSSHDWK